MSIFGMIFWVWLAVSMVVFIGRRVKGRAGGGAAADPPDGPDVIGSPPRSMIESAPAGAAPVDGGPPGLGRSEEDFARGDGAMFPIDDPAPRPRTLGETSRLRSSLGIADALSGIRMPCDLAPLTLGVADLDPAHIDLVTSGVAAGEVTAQLDAELSRLGYAIDDLGGGEQLATRDDVVVRVRVHDRPALSVGAGGRGFPTAPPDSLVVELAVASR